MAERLKGRMRRIGFGTRRGSGLLATALMTAGLTLPLASGALASRTPMDSGTPAASNASNASNDGTAQDAPGFGQSALRTQLGRRQAAILEQHIATLHRRLRVTPIQEPLWQQLAAAMRGSVVQLDRVYAERETQPGHVSAVDDLKSYGSVQEIRARNVASLVEPLQHLYDSFSASQKTEADETFRSFTEAALKTQR